MFFALTLAAVVRFRITPMGIAFWAIYFDHSPIRHGMHGILGGRGEAIRSGSIIYNPNKISKIMLSDWLALAYAPKRRVASLSISEFSSARAVLERQHFTRVTTFRTLSRIPVFDRWRLAHRHRDPRLQPRPVAGRGEAAAGPHSPQAGSHPHPARELHVQLRTRKPECALHVTYTLPIVPVLSLRQRTCWCSEWCTLPYRFSFHST